MRKRKYISPQMKVVETSLEVAFLVGSRVQLEIDHNSQVVSGCSNEQGCLKIWD